MKSNSPVANKRGSESKPTTVSTRPVPVPTSFYCSVFIDLLSVAVVVPFMSRHAAILGISASYVGVVQAIYGAMQIVSTPLLGTMSDMYGPRIFLLLSVGGTSLAYLLLAYSLHVRSIPLFVASRILVGSCRQTMSVGSSFISGLCRSSAGHQREEDETMVSRGLSIFQSCTAMGFVVGPVVGGFLGDHIGVVEATALSGLLDAANVVLMWFATRKSRAASYANKNSVVASADSAPSALRRNPLSLAWKILVAQQESGKLLAVMYLYSMSYIMLQSMLPIILRQLFHFEGRYIGLTISAASGTNAVVLSLALPKLLQRYSSASKKDDDANSTRLHVAKHPTHRIAVVSMMCALTGYTIIACSPTVPQLLGSLGAGTPWTAFVVGQAILSLTSCVADVLNRSRFTTLFPKERSGEVLSIVYSIDGCNRVIAPLLGGLLIDVVGIEGPLMCAAGTCAIATLLFYRLG